MKKNKKFWKKEAKALGERCDELEETLDRYMFQVIILEDEVGQLTDERDRLKNELSVFRQYNIGKPYGTDSITSTNTNYKVLNNKEWAEKFIKDNNIPVGMDEKGKKTVEDLAKPAEKSIIRWLKFDK
jgi:hypothetical protein